MAIGIYKSNQGRYVRSLTGVGFALVDLAVAYFIWRQLAGPLKEMQYLVYAIPAAFFAIAAAVEFYYLNKPNVVDFMIATESEMKKVSWSNKAELIGSTMVVIGTVVLLALVMWLSDTLVIMLYTRGFRLW